MRMLVLAAALAWAAAASAQQDWPSRPVHMIVPFPAGSSPDLIARILAEKLSPALGQPAVVENRPGAGGNLGTALVAKAARGEFGVVQEDGVRPVQGSRPGVPGRREPERSRRRSEARGRHGEGAG